MDIARLSVAPRNELIDLSWDSYAEDRDAVRKGWLDLIERSPAHLKIALDEKSNQKSDALIRGGICHTFVLEPDLIQSRYYRQPEGNRIRKAVREAVQEAALLNRGKQGVRAEHWDLAIRLRDAVYAHKGAAAVLGADGKTEQSILWDNGETGELCKARFDKLSVGKAFIADFKTAADASPAGFQKALARFNYDLQVAHYTEPVGLRFVFVVAETAPPYAVAVYAAGDDVLNHGNNHRAPLLRTYAECRARNEWPSYPESIQRISMPRWAK